MCQIVKAFTELPSQVVTGILYHVGIMERGDELLLKAQLRVSVAPSKSFSFSFIEGLLKGKFVCTCPDNFLYFVVVVVLFIV